MTTNPNAPHFVLAAMTRIYPELPSLVGADAWTGIQPQIDQYIAELKAQPNAYLASTQLFGLLARYEPARQRLTMELKIQEVINQNINGQLREIAAKLGIDESGVDGLSAAAFARLAWEVDPTTVPAPEERNHRTITLSEGGIDGGKSVKFKNMRLDLGDLSKIVAGFAMAGFDIVDKPHPYMIAAGILLTIHALYDASKLDLSEQEASLFWGMIQTSKLKPSETEILTITNAERAKIGLDALTDKQVRHSLTKLAQIKSIEKDGDGYHIIENYHIED